MGYWKSKVVPMIKKLFDKNTAAKKAAATEACKTFDDIYKEAINKEIEEKKTQLQPKVVETYEATSAEVKALVKEPTEDGLKEYGAEVHKFLEELVKIEFPGSKAVCEALTNHGVTLISGPIFFIFEKVSTFLPVEEKSRELPEEMKAEASKEEAKTEETSTEPAKEIVVEKKEEADKSEGKKPEEKVEEKKPEEKKPEVKVEEKKPEDKTNETKKEEKVEEKKEVAAATTTTTSEPKKP